MSSHAHALAVRLLAARNGSGPAQWRDLVPAERADAYSLQDAVMAQLGVIGGWKVGAKGPAVEPTCAPMPASGLLRSGAAALIGPPWTLRCIEVELAVRLGRDLPAAGGIPSAAEIMAAIDAVLPAIEVVETRLADWHGSEPLAALADLQSHGALVLGEPSALRPQDIDLRTVQASLAFDGQSVARTQGANPAADIWRLLGWLAHHCAQRGTPLRAGDVITTGSCTGMLFAPEGAHVQGLLTGLGKVELRF